jgi:hypothetical protein
MRPRRVAEGNQADHLESFRDAQQFLRALLFADIEAEVSYGVSQTSFLPQMMIVTGAFSENWETCPEVSFSKAAFFFSSSCKVANLACICFVTNSAVKRRPLPLPAKPANFLRATRSFTMINRQGCAFSPEGFQDQCQVLFGNGFLRPFPNAAAILNDLHGRVSQTVHF